MPKEKNKKCRYLLNSFDGIKLFQNSGVDLPCLDKCDFDLNKAYLNEHILLIYFQFITNLIIKS